MRRQFMEHIVCLGVLRTEIIELGKEVNLLSPQCQDRLVEFSPVGTNELWKHVKQGYDLVRGRTQCWCSV